MHIWDAVLGRAPQEPAEPKPGAPPLCLRGGEVRALHLIVSRLAREAAGTRDPDLVDAESIASALSAGGPIGAILAADAAEAVARLIRRGLAGGTIHYPPNGERVEVSTRL